MSEDEQRYVVGIELSAELDRDDDAVSDSSRLDVDVDGMGLTMSPADELPLVRLVGTAQ